MAEAQVLALLAQHNRPFTLQIISDYLAPKGIKKAQAQKALDALVEARKVITKEFGKTTLYIPPQEGLKVLSKEEFEATQAQVKQLQQELQEESQKQRVMEAELKEWSSSLTEAQLAARILDLTQKATLMDAKLTTLRYGAKLITPQERAAVEKEFLESMDAWRKRRAIFRNIWDAVSENIEGKQADLLEEMGVETDEAAGLTIKELEPLLPKKRRL